MKKLTLIIATVVLGFVMAACSTPSPREAIMQQTEDLFAQAELEVQAITNAEDFVNFFFEFDERRDDFVNELFEKYPTDDEGNFKGMTEAENEELNNYIYERATAYNVIEAKKCGEFLEPYLEQFENVTNTLYGVFQNTGLFTEDMHQQLYDAYERVALFQGIDNIPEELVDRYQAAMEKANEMIDTVEFEEEDED